MARYKELRDEVWDLMLSDVFKCQCVSGLWFHLSVLSCPCCSLAPAAPQHRYTTHSLASRPVRQTESETWSGDRTVNQSQLSVAHGLLSASPFQSRTGSWQRRHLSLQHHHRMLQRANAKHMGKHCVCFRMRNENLPASHVNACGSSPGMSETLG